jgi:hypothetical protein
MNNKKDYIDLREGAIEREAVGNGPRPSSVPPVPSAPAYAPPVRKGNTLIIVIIAISSLLVFATLITAVMGFVFFSAVSPEMHTQVTTEILTANVSEDWARQIEFDTINFTRDIEEWGIQFGIDMENWARDLEDNLMAWSEDWVNEYDLPYDLRGWLEFLRYLEGRSSP